MAILPGLLPLGVWARVGVPGPGGFSMAADCWDVLSWLGGISLDLLGDNWLLAWTLFNFPYVPVDIKDPIQ